MSKYQTSLTPSPFGPGPYVEYRDRPWLKDFHPENGNWRINEDSADHKLYQFTANSLPVRKNLCSIGQPINVEVNYFEALFQPSPNLKIHQYDVKMWYYKDLNTEVGARTELTRKLKEKVWNSRAVSQLMGKYAIYNGDKIAW
jgi:argonaute-like protein